MDNAKLKTALEQHENIPFPGAAQNEELQDWIGDLVEADDYFVGLAHSALQGENLDDIDFEDLKYLTKKIESLRHLPTADKVIRHQGEVYLKSLKQIAELLH